MICTLATIANTDAANAEEIKVHEMSQEFSNCVSRHMLNNTQFLSEVSEEISKLNEKINLADKAPRDQLTILLTPGNGHNFIQYIRSKTATTILHKCPQGFLELINDDNLSITYAVAPNPDTNLVELIPTAEVTYGNRYPAFDMHIKIRSLHKFIPGVYAFIMTEDRTDPGDTISKKALDYNPWSRNCSSHHPGAIVYDSDSLNIAGQRADVFGGGYEYFLDVHYGDTLAFPGLILADKDASTSEQIMTFKSVGSAITKAEALVNALKGTACAGMTLNLVSLDQIQHSTATRDLFWGATAAATGSVIATYGVGAYAAGSLVNVAAISSSVPGIGWAVGLVLLTASATMSLMDSDILDYPNKVHDAFVLKSWTIE